MAQTIRDVMTPNPTTVPAKATVVEAARTMREADIGDVLVTENGGKLRGILTDRDIVVRVLADGLDPASTPVEDISSEVLVTVSPLDPVDAAIRLMREKAIRRLPVVDGDRPVGIVSLGDLAVERDPKSVLGEISAAPPNE
jgi:CBS domain-containing protein